MSSALGVSRLVLLGAVACLGAPRVARADGAVSTPAAEAGPRQMVRLVIAGDDGESSGALEASVRELVARLDLTLETSRAERLDLDTPGALTESSGLELATAWVDLRAARASLAIVAGRTGRVVARRSVERDRSAAIVVEELAHIIQASVEELADQERRRARPPAPAAAPPPAPPSSPPAPRAEAARWSVDAGGFFGGRAFGAGAEGVVGGGGLAGAALGRGPWRPAVWLVGTYHVAFDVRGHLVDVHTKAVALRLAPALRLVGGERWFIEGGPQGGFDVMWTQPRANSAGLPTGRLGAASADASPVLGAMLAAHVAVGTSADLLFALSTDIDLSPHRFVVAEGAQTEVLFAPWRVRPALLLGFTFNIVGELPYAPAAAAPP